MHIFQPPGLVCGYVVPSLRATVWAEAILQKLGYEFGAALITGSTAQTACFRFCALYISGRVS